MKPIDKKLKEIISLESNKPSNVNELKGIEKILIELKSAGLLKQPNYNLPMVDTIGKTYYSLISKD